MKNKDECLELKNIKYKTMLMNNIQSSKEPDVTNIESFLEKERNINKKQHWSKLSKLTKKNKILDYWREYSNKHQLPDTEKQELKVFLLKSLDRKKLQRVKDVIYDVETQMIINIPTLTINKQTNKYTLKNLDKKISTLKSLAPRKKKKKKVKKDKKDKEDENNDKKVKKKKVKKEKEDENNDKKVKKKKVKKEKVKKEKVKKEN